MIFELCPKSPNGDSCHRPKGSECLLPERGVCDNFVSQEAAKLTGRAKAYCKYWNTKNKKLPAIVANENAIYVAIKSTLDDIYRYKWYHLSDPRSNLADSVKLSAYTSKWITKIKPLEYKKELIEAQKDDISGLTINAIFALHLARTYIATEVKRDFYFAPHYEDEFIYDLFYRELNSDGLLHIFQNIFTAAKKGRAGVLDFPKKRNVRKKTSRATSRPT